jgi:hypothetical protein
LAAHARECPRWTLVNVKLLRSPRQSRGISQLIEDLERETAPEVETQSLAERLILARTVNAPPVRDASPPRTPFEKALAARLVAARARLARAGY